MAAPTTPWMTSDKLVDIVKKRIMFPISEITFTDADILSFATEEMFGSQIPSVLQYHEEYFIQVVTVPLVQNQTRYPIPNRALGMKLRYLFFQDITNQLYDMTRINPNDQGYFLNNTNSNNTPYAYYVENNSIVLSVTNIDEPTGNLVMGFYLRPNQLVPNADAATITSFQKTIDIVASEMEVGDVLSLQVNLQLNAPPIHGEFLYPQPFSATTDSLPTVETTFTAVASNAGVREFVIDPASSINTATNLVNAINDDNTYSASNGTPGTDEVSLTFYDINTQFITSNSSAMIIPLETIAVCDGGIPDGFTNNTYYDILQTKPGHKILNYDILLGNNAISGNTITFPFGTIPTTTVIGDYVCLANQCIIPMLPPELHNILAERTCARILIALGDTEALQNTNSKIQEMEQRQANMVDNRVEGNAQKILNRRGLLSTGKIFRRGMW